MGSPKKNGKPKPTKIDQLQLDPENARTRSDRASDNLQSSLEQFGAARSVVMDADGVIRAGNGTVEAAIAAGITKVKVIKGNPDELVVVQRSDLEGEAAAAYAIADNRTGELAEWDLDVLESQLESLKDFNAESLGFSESDLSDLFPADPEDLDDVEPQIDRADELQKEWGTKENQLWLIKGQQSHRLLCGDSTKAEDVERLMGGEKATVAFIDPPYNIASDSKNFAASASKAMSDLESADWDREFDPADWHESILASISEDATLYWCTSHFLAGQIWDWMKTWATHHEWCVWEKPNPMPSLSKRHWTWNAELICYATRGRHVFNFPTEGHAPCVWTFTKKKETQHPTEKVVDVPAMAIQHSSNIGDLVSDICLGSGTTMLAAEQLNRRCYGMEISPKYVAVILQRMKDAGCECKLEKQNKRKSR